MGPGVRRDDGEAVRQFSNLTSSGACGGVLIAMALKAGRPFADIL